MLEERRLEIRPAEYTELDQIARLEKEIFSDAWSLESLKETWRQKNAVILVAKEEQIAGYVIFYYVLDEGEIARIATKPSLRRHGVAMRLFQGLSAFCDEKKTEKIMLEVRKSNESAQKFYRKCGFEEDGIRKNYYDNPREDAVLMSQKR